MATRLVRPLRLRLPNAENDRHATWLELFYDLVFSVAVSVLGARLNQSITVIGVLEFVLLFVSIWWAWCGHTVYDTRFDTDDGIQRLITFMMMLAAAAMAVYIPQAFESREKEFAIAYIVARGSLLVMYLRAHLTVSQARTITTIYLTGFGIGVSLWIVSLLFPPPVCYLFRTVGLAIDLIVPWLARPKLSRAPLDTTHIPERFASFTIIVLGEIIYVIVSAVAATQVTALVFLAALLSFAVTACIWWVYFTFFSEAPVTDSLGSGQPYIYAHLPIVIGLTLIGIGLGRAVEEVTGPALAVETRALLGTGIAVWLLSAMLLKLVTMRRLPSQRVLLRLSALLFVFLLMSTGGVLSPLLVLSLLVLVLIAYAFFEMRYWTQWERKTRSNLV